MVRTRLNIGCRYSTPVRERPLHPTRGHFTPEPSQTQAPVTPATEPERRAGGSLTTPPLAQIHNCPRNRGNSTWDTTPGTRMRTLWGLLLADRVKVLGPDLDLYGWRSRFERDGLTTTLRLELREMISPRVSLREPFRWPFSNEEDHEEPGRIRQLVDWDIVLTT